MDHLGRCSILLTAVVLQCFMKDSVLSIQKREWVSDQTAKTTGGEVTCFSEYMETWIHSTMIEGLVIWLSEALQIQVRPTSLDHLNLQLSACGFSLHKDPDDNFAFRVSYTGCLVQQQHSFHVLKMNLVKRTSRFGGRPHSLLMTCPVVSVLPNMEHIQCDPEYIQVIRQVPFDNWENELHWSLSSRERLVVALEDASLIQMSVDVNGSHIAVQGRRSEVLSPVERMGNGEFLALKLVSGQYAYSMEATCPTVTSSTAAQTALHIFKRRMGLTKRGRSDGEGLSVGSVWVKQTRRFTVRDAGGFVALTVPTEQILQTRTCAESEQLVQPFYRVDVVLTFRETNHKMHWTMENTLPCTARPAGSRIASSPGPSLDHEEPGPVDHTTVPAGKPEDRAPMEDVTTTTAPRTWTEGGRLHFHTEDVSEGQSESNSSGFHSETFVSISELFNGTTSAHDLV